MKLGTYKFTKVGSDEVIGESEMGNGFFKLARIYLSNGGVKSPDDEIVGYLAAFISADMAGVPGVKVEPSKVNDAYVAKLMCEFDVEVADIAVADGEEQAVEENPTGTSGGSC